MRGWSLTDGSSGSGETEELECRDRNSEARLFCISVDVRSFKANMHLPMRSANVFVRVALPPEIVRVAVESCAMSSKVTAPLRTHPPVLVSRGTEVSISNGYVALDLPASPDGMAAMLALQPAVTAHVLHRDKYAADSVLGLATIPLKRLMDQPCADGYAPVHGATNVAGKIDDVKIGALRVVLAIEDMGPLVALDASKVKTGAVSQDHVKQPMPEDPTVSKLMTGYIFGSGGSSCAEQGEVQGQHTSEETELGEVPKISSKSSTPFNRKRKNPLLKKKVSSPVKTPPLCSDVQESVEQSDVHEVDGIRKQPEYEMAWEFEMWRRSEEAKWRADLKEKEAAKLHAIEEEWRKRERERALELRNSQAQQADLEVKLQAKLFKLEKRERSIILAEEDLSHRKEVLERANINRSSEAQIAVKRLQAECEHRVDLERSKYVALQEQYSALEQRLATANSSLAALEKQFQDFKAAQRNTSETALIGQVMALKQQCGTLQHKAELALHARDDYKNQVLKMAKELARLHREHMKAQVQQATQERSRAESETVAALVESQSRKAREDRLELQRLKEQLDLLQLREQESMTVTATAKQQSDHISPRKEESMSLPDHSFLPLRKTNVPRLDLSKTQDEKDGMAHTDLRIFQEMRNKLKYDKANPISWSRQPLTEMGQKQKKPVMSDTKGTISNVETRYHDPRSADMKNEDSALHNLDSAAEASRSKVEYLIKQRGELLKTGVYNEKDRVIKGLDQEIQQLKSANRDLNP